MNSLKEHYQAVIEHIAADIKTLLQSGEIADAVSLKLLQKRHEWLIYRRDRLNEQRKQIISGFRKQLDAYLCQCEGFWKSKHERTYEKKLAQLNEAKRRVAQVYALSGFDACYALMLTLKHLRSILPLPQYEEYAPALAAMEAIKDDCYRQLGTYIKP
jgi:DNA repair exonuclease SbcCD ATPase subunit